MTNEERALKLTIDIITANEDCSDTPASDIPKIILAYADEIRRECWSRIHKERFSNAELFAIKAAIMSKEAEK